MMANWVYPIILMIFIAPYGHAYADVTACSSTNWVPYNWETKDSLEGGAIKLLQQFFRQQKINFEARKVGSWARCLKLVESGEIDIVIGAYKSNVRAAWGHYVSEPMGFDDIYIFIKQGSKIKYDTLDDLAQYRGGGVIGDIYGATFDNFKAKLPADKWSETTTYYNNIKKVLAQRIDYLPSASWNTKSMLFHMKNTKEIPINAELEQVGQPIQSNPLYFIVSKKSRKYAQFGEALSRFIKVKKEAGEIDTLLRTAFEDFKETHKGK